MEEKYFVHRIQEENEAYTKGIEVHDTLDSAIRSFWGRVKTGYGNPENPGMKFVSCKVTDSSGAVVGDYDLTWRKAGEDGNVFFCHHIKVDGATVDKGIDVCEDFDVARLAYAKYMEYGYNNTKFPDISYVSCKITDRSGSVLDPFDETWIKPEANE